jgi:iron complex transport system substrate-binding protein
MSLVKKALIMTQTAPFMPRTLADIWRMLRSLGQDDAALTPLRRRLLSLQVRTAAVERQRLLIVEDMLPLKAAGWWMPELAELVGADLVISRKGEAPVDMTMADISAAAPDLIVLACTGKNLADNSAAALLFADLGCPVFAADAKDYFSAPSAALVDSAEILAEILHQDARLHFGHAGKHWRQISPLNPRYPQA